MGSRIVVRANGKGSDPDMNLNLKLSLANEIFILLHSLGDWNITIAAVEWLIVDRSSRMQAMLWLAEYLRFPAIRTTRTVRR